MALSGASSKVSDVENRSVMRMGRVGRGMEEEGRIGVADADQRSGVCVELVASMPFKRLAKKAGHQATTTSRSRGINTSSILRT